MRNRILAKIYKDLKKIAKSEETFFTKVTFDINVIYDGGDIQKTEQYTLSEFLADYEDYGYDLCKQLSDETYVKVTIDNETDDALIFWRNPKNTASKETIQKEVLQKLKNKKDMLVNVLYDTDILDVFDDGDVETDNEEYLRILDGDSDYTEKIDISVYVNIIPDSIKFL